MKGNTALAFAATIMVAAVASAAAAGVPSIVATAALNPANSGVAATGKAVFTIYSTTNATMEVTLRGALQNLWGSHIHQNTTGGPVLVDLLPALNSTTPVMINPMLSFKGTLRFVSPVNIAASAALTPGLNFPKFLQLLSAGSLYVNIHTMADMSGALTGTLKCTAPCALPPL